MYSTAVEARWKVRKHEQRMCCRFFSYSFVVVWSGCDDRDGVPLGGWYGCLVLASEYIHTPYGGCVGEDLRLRERSSSKA